MHIRLEKFNHVKRQKRYHVLRVTQTLFGDWCLEREWGQIDGNGGHKERRYLSGLFEAQTEVERLKALDLEKGYAVIPVQMGLL
ncbi:WGR domain-containing protein [Shimia thalassica]|uniref:WGR domain-containing protein n=1 Tax=Shimia thalassica TaxID=1715693 RepID=A0A0P1I672_9RHOB|nr:WGR domain-containing protein [Shimia thalassica]PHO03569.1 WGR domain-containing protein [Rhodobacteraceae bacterium 4F10]MBU2942078.1 WGR domain-containing protein [Shimia thalassica]MDO6478276.1 WGR domain-containing protein [Shimia thalassica]MDO6482905.1 WGR domain-containing protein [Shimia thalassica]MDO6502953.1 WGR domain-containing protein [Shimia thalassica]